MSKDSAIRNFADVRAAYDRLLPKLKRLVTEFGMGDRIVPGTDETYSELLHREQSHCLAIYNEEEYEALNSHPMSEIEYDDAASAFAIDLEEIRIKEMHVDILLA